MTEVYSKSSDFGNQLAEGQFHAEIEADPGITTTLLYVETVGDTVNVVFQSTISGSEQTALDAVVAAHTPDITNSIDTVPGYIELNSTLADAQAVRLNASDAAGGIDINAGTGGIAIDTTNGISLDGAAACNFTTTSGNLVLDATAGLVNIDGGSGINIGTQAEAQPINIGTAAAARTITIGNTTGATSVDVDTGTGGFIVDTASGGAISLDATGASCNFTLASTGAAQDLTIALTGSNDSSIILDSQGTGADSIRLNSAGGIDIDATSACTLDVGGYTLNSGTNAINIGTDAAAHTVTIGSLTTTSSTVIRSGTGGLVLGNDANSGEVHVANGSSAKTVYLGNSVSGSRLFTRWNSVKVGYQGAETGLSNGNATLTMSQLFTQILTMTPTTARTLTLPTAADAVSAISGVAVNDCIEFRIINLGTAANDPEITVAMGTGGTAVGRMETDVPVNNAGTYTNSGVGIYRMRFTNITVSSEAYTVYRV